jgi:hypothetical protein
VKISSLITTNQHLGKIEEMNKRVETAISQEKSSPFCGKHFKERGFP